MQIDKVTIQKHDIHHTSHDLLMRLAVHLARPAFCNASDFYDGAQSMANLRVTLLGIGDGNDFELQLLRFF